MFPAPKNNRRWHRAASLLLIVASAVFSTPTRADDADEVDRFLTRLGLVDLRIIHLENALEKQKQPDTKKKLARRLADMYTERLMALADDPVRYDALLKRVSALLKEIPEANTVAMQVMLLQADYNRAEALMVKWLDDSSQKEVLKEAGDLLARIAPALTDHQSQLVKTLERITDDLDKLEDAETTKEKDQRAVLEQEFNRLNAVAGRAAYFAGWSNYYRGISKQNAFDARQELARARKAFRDFLGIEEEDKYSEVDTSWLQLQSARRSQSFIGLGLTEVARGNLDEARTIFQLLEGGDAPATVRDLAAYWFLRGLLNANRMEAAMEYAEEKIGKFTGAATQGKVSFCVLAVKTAYAAAGDASTERQRLGELGVRGLAKLRQFNALGQLMAKYKIELEEGGFYLTWIQGQQQFHQAEKSKSKEQYRAAIELLTAALEQPEANTDITAAGDCRYTLAWCLYRLEQYEPAAKQFRRAADALGGAGGDSAALQAAWMTFVVYQRLSKTESRYVTSAIDILDSIKRDFPESPQAKKADFYIAKLRQSAADPEDSIRRLARVKPSDSNYLSALYEICLLRHQQWKKVRGSKAKGQAAAGKLNDAVEEYLKAARRDGNNHYKLKCYLLAVEVAMAATPPKTDNVKSYLNTSRSLVEALPEGNSAVREYHFRRLQMAKQTDDISAVHLHANWLADHAVGSVYELSAVISLSQKADDEVERSDASNRAESLQNARNIYTRLVALVGEGASQIKAQPNALVANSKLARYEFETGRPTQAAARLEKILAAKPNDTSYLRRAGLSHFRAGQWEPALKHWNTLVSGLTGNTEAWFEAKYHQLACLAKLDKQQAQQIHRQFKLLYPQVKSQLWRDKFAELDRTLTAK